MANCIVPKKPTLFASKAWRAGTEKVGYHDVSINCNGFAALIFKEIWANDASTPQAAPNSQS